MRAGANDFLVKPASPERLLVSIRNQLKIGTLSVEVKQLKKKADNRLTFDDLIAASAEMQQVLKLGARAAQSDIPILIEGESGAGKELIARAIQGTSSRAGKPFVTVNCGAIPENLIESLLFGHEKGSFTGAVAMRKGRFEMADNGTLFLDEIGEISNSFQAKLLRVLQEGEFERVGGSRTLKVNVRLVSATNRDLEDAVTKGIFRADLYYRISVVPLFLPALRDRPGDIPMLAQAFLDRFNRDNKTGLTFSPAALTTLQGCYFPGNVRELENCVRRTATLAQGDCVVDRDLSCRNDGCLSSILWRNVPRPAKLVEAVPAVPASVPPVPEAPARAAPFAKEPLMGGRSDHDALLDAMERAGWVQAKAARLLNVTPRQIGYALRRHHIPIKKF
jgi:Nif-specific regulatory protein